ncbi:MAG TPA: sigma factor [Acidimicrobiales bacterium]|nr:sigma factor [Acidimicrobiales bacterium]
MRGDREASEVCRYLYPRLVGALGLFCGDRAMAEDLAQEALARLWERWAKPRRPDHPMACATGVGVNLARSAAQRRGIEKAVLRRVAVDPAGAGARGGVALPTS